MEVQGGLSRQIAATILEALNDGWNGLGWRGHAGSRAGDSVTRKSSPSFSVVNGKDADELRLDQKRNAQKRSDALIPFLALKTFVILG